MQKINLTPTFDVFAFRIVCLPTISFYCDNFSVFSCIKSAFLCPLHQYVLPLLTGITFPNRGRVGLHHTDTRWRHRSTGKSLERLLSREGAPNNIPQGYQVCIILQKVLLHKYFSFFWKLKKCMMNYICR